MDLIKKTKKAFFTKKHYSASISATKSKNNYHNGTFMYALAPITIVDCEKMEKGKIVERKVPAFARIYKLNKCSDIPNTEIISYNYIDSGCFLVQTDILQNCAVSFESYENASLTIKGPNCNFCWKINQFDRKDASKYIYFSHIESYETEYITLPLIAIYASSEQEAVDAFSPGIIDVMQKYVYLTQEENIDVDEQYRLIMEVSDFLKDVYHSIEKMGGIIDYSSQTKSIQELIDEKAKSVAEREQMEREKAEQRKEKHDLFIEQIKSRRELISEFNKI